AQYWQSHANDSMVHLLTQPFLQAPHAGANPTSQTSVPSVQTDLSYQSSLAGTASMQVRFHKGLSKQSHSLGSARRVGGTGPACLSFAMGISLYVDAEARSGSLTDCGG